MSSPSDSNRTETAFPGVRTRVWRNGTLERENFPFELVSDYLEDPDCLVLAAIIAVPTAVTGYFGQNVPYPGFAHEWGTHSASR